MAGKRLGVGFVGGGFVGSSISASLWGSGTPTFWGSSEKTTSWLGRRRHWLDPWAGERQGDNSITEMIADPGIDALWICAPNFTRIEVMEEVVDAIEAGKGARGHSLREASWADGGRSENDVGVDTAGWCPGRLSGKPALYTIRGARGRTSFGRVARPSRESPSWPGPPRNTGAPTCPGSGKGEAPRWRGPERHDVPFG